MHKRKFHTKFEHLSLFAKKLRFLIFGDVTVRHRVTSPNGGISSIKHFLEPFLHLLYYLNREQALNFHNRPFAAGGHTVQNPKYWRAKECDRLQNKKNN